MAHRVRPEDARPRRDVDERALRLRGALADHVDHAVDRVGAPDAAARPANDLDSVDIEERHVLRLPEHAREHRRVDRASVDAGRASCWPC